ncbi:efflux RND transporter permease subunit [Legionella jamestowniensis]|uniref:Integral membrane protein, AcrB/AcrD/AcrF family n=1 Tax=Legionella jamestowniensis TaxID=455 RepID=A0A0W0UNF1_9GAMM|nr:efflux RND transporter permease subunit [Legionella jamestowniensis]KTD09406.1 integral membrane protein, AcrB/AcrD/AcrF family [Legionella jamestowniensis]OCH99232.1 multidrug transporter [Legionella jamestowniensis]SFL88758.1 multidrug efflux pump [Legionella jamestowniensis DSM 19215]
MNLPPYFIKHPVIAIVLNCMLIVIGLLCLSSLPVREYPNISFPTITVSTTYPNASSELVESDVTTILEERLAGVEGLETITSQSSSGSSYITLSFRSGISMDRALSATQDAVTLAKPLLPVEVKTPAIERQKKSNGLPFIGLSLESSSMDFGELTHFANLNLKNTFRSLKGVSSVDVWGQPYTYAIRLDPKKLFSFGINVDEVFDAIGKSSVSLPAGNFQNKIPSTVDFELKTVRDYENLLIKTNNHHPVFLKSIAKVKLTTDKDRMRVRVNGHAGLALAINRADDANPLEVSKLVRQELNHLKENLPDDVKINAIIDQSDFINASLKNIQSSIVEAIILVLVIVFIFLRNGRATLIPLVTIPISLLGSLIFLKLFGFSINLMTLLAMVLAVGLVVDDAIIVLENIWRHIEEGLSPLDAAMQGSKEIGFAIVAMTLTLASVYAPVAFIPGMLGQIFIEFAVALAGSVFISGLVSLTLSPLMCARFLNKNSKPLWPRFDYYLKVLEQKYASILSHTIERKKLIVAGLVCFLGCSLFFFSLLSKETAPKEDRGLIGVYTPMLAGENLQILDKKISPIENKVKSFPDINNQLTFIGDWGASVVLPLKPHSQRKRSSTALVNELQPQLNNFPSMDAHVWSWDTALPGIDDAGSGSELTLVISTVDNFRQLLNEVEQLKQTLDQSKEFASIRYDLRLDSMGYSIEIDNNALSQLGLSAKQVAKTIEVFFSGDKSLNFQKDGVSYNLTLQGTPSPWTLNELYLTTPSGKHVSLGAFTTMKPKAQPPTLDHHNQMRSTTLHVGLLPQDSIKKGMDKIMTMARNELPAHYKMTWEGAAKAYTQSSNTMVVLFVLSLFFIFAILSVQFENFIDPLIIMFTVPLASSGALLFAYLFKQSFNIYTQIGLITLIGLISKHGILIVEFANQLRKTGLSVLEAAQKAAVLRLRPILMTTGAMLFGVFPLILTHDAGAESRHAIGFVLLGGLSLGTLLTLFVLPTVYSMVKQMTLSREEK